MCKLCTYGPKHDTSTIKNMYLNLENRFVLCDFECKKHRNTDKKLCDKINICISLKL